MQAAPIAAAVLSPLWKSHNGGSVSFMFNVKSGVEANYVYISLQVCLWTMRRLKYSVLH